jgi:SAM-dependent methyltransferase
VDEIRRESAARLRAQIELGAHEASLFRAALLDVPALDRDAWVDCVLGLDEIPADGPELPRGCTPYLPCSVDALLRIVEHAPVRASDVFVDIGAGVGRAIALVNLLTGATAIGIEIQSGLARASRELAARLLTSRVSCVEGDIKNLSGCIAGGSIFFLYCPFSGGRLSHLLAELERIAETRTVRVCCVDLPLPPCDWLTLETSLGGDLAIYRSTLLVKGGPLAGSPR